MPHTIKRTQKQRILSIIACFYILLQPTYGRDRQDYAENSILAEGNWVKISTTDAGIYQITEDSLRAWGFTDPSKIKLFGYGGTVIDELFANSDNYIDDLPQIPQTIFLFARHYQMVFRFCQSRICTSASPLFYICLLFPDR